jgi:hypothetical protein
MSPFWSNIIIRTVLRPKHKDDVQPVTYSSYDVAKGWYEW